MAMVLNVYCNSSALWERFDFYVLYSTSVIRDDDAGLFGCAVTNHSTGGPASAVECAGTVAVAAARRFYPELAWRSAPKTRELFQLSTDDASQSLLRSTGSKLE